jgi:hypothetical protein
MKMKVIWYMEASDEKIKPHFKASEFQCKDKTEGLLVAADLVNILEEIRNHFNIVKLYHNRVFQQFNKFSTNLSTFFFACFLRSVVIK